MAVMPVSAISQKVNYNINFGSKKQRKANNATMKDLARVPVETLMAALMLNLSSAKINAAENKYYDRIVDDIEVVDDYNAEEVSAPQVKSVIYNKNNNGKLPFVMNNKKYILSLENTEGDPSTFNQVMLSTLSPEKKLIRYKLISLDKANYFLTSDNGRKERIAADSLYVMKVEDDWGKDYKVYSKEANRHLLKMLNSPDNKGAIKLRENNVILRAAPKFGLVVRGANTIPIPNENAGKPDFGNPIPEETKKYETKAGDYTVRFYDTNNDKSSAEIVTLQLKGKQEMQIKQLTGFVTSFIADLSPQKVAEFSHLQIDLAAEKDGKVVSTIVDNGLGEKLLNIISRDNSKAKTAFKFEYIKRENLLY